MKLFVFGYGYTSRALVRRLRPSIDSLAVTVRSPERAAALRAEGLCASSFDAAASEVATSVAIPEALATAETVLVSVPPDAAGDPVLRHCGPELGANPALRSLVYLSTIGVYGDFAGGWVDETTPPRASSERALRRLKAEEQWLAFGREKAVPVQILRLAGIYGPGRNALCDLENGTARRLLKPDQVFNRIHVDDIALVAEAAMRQPESKLWNVSDDEPCPPQDVVALAATLLGLPVPPLLAYETAELTPMARAFYSENKRVSNRAIRERLGVTLVYPSYREGLAGLLAGGEGRNGARSERQKDRAVGAAPGSG